MSQIRLLDRSALLGTLLVVLILGLTGCQSLAKGIFSAGNALSCAQGNELSCEDPVYGVGDAEEEEDDDSDGPMSFEEVVRSLADSVEAMTPDEDETYVETQRTIRKATEQARRREEAERQRKEARRKWEAVRQSGGMPAMGGRPGVAPTEDERERAERQEQRRQREAWEGARGDRRRSASKGASRVRVRVSAEDRWTRWTPMPGRPNLLMRARITSYNSAAKKYMWSAQFENRYSEEVCHSYGIGPVGQAEATARHWLDPGERDGVWFLVPVGPGGTAEVISENFELEDGCF